MPNEGLRGRKLIVNLALSVYIQYIALSLLCVFNSFDTSTEKMVLKKFKGKNIQGIIMYYQGGRTNTIFWAVFEV